MADRLRIETVVSMPYQENSYVVWKDGQRDCFVIDPGFEPERIVRLLEQHDLELTSQLITHGHVDHIAGIAFLKEQFPDVPIIIGHAEARMLTDPFLNLSAFSGAEVLAPPADLLVHEGQIVEAIGIRWLVREITGHSPGHVVYIGNELNPPIIFGGDVLFAGSVGRGDFPGGDLGRLVEGIKEKLYGLPDEAIVYPGHGMPTTIGAERATNPYTG